MGVFNGSVSVTKFFVKGTVPKSFAQSYLKNIEARRFTELLIDEDVEERSGWCVAGNGLDLDLRHEKVFLNSYVVLGMRVDKWRIPRPLFKAQFAQAQAEHLARTGKEKLSKREKDDLKLRVNRRLRKKVIPTMKQFDVCWELNRKELWFWCRSTRQIDDLMTLFEQTFSLDLIEASPYTIGAELLGDKSAEALCELEPSFFGSVEPSPSAEQ
jgi:recombination associated protein RdgC